MHSSSEASLGKMIEEVYALKWEGNKPIKPASVSMWIWWEMTLAFKASAQWLPLLAQRVPTLFCTPQADTSILRPRRMAMTSLHRFHSATFRDGALIGLASQTKISVMCQRLPLATPPWLPPWHAHCSNRVHSKAECGRILLLPVVVLGTEACSIIGQTTEALPNNYPRVPLPYVWILTTYWTPPECTIHLIYTPLEPSAPTKTIVNLSF